MTSGLLLKEIKRETDTEEIIYFIFTFAVTIINSTTNNLGINAMALN